MVLKGQFKECTMEFLNRTLKYLNINVKDADSTPYMPIRMKRSISYIPAM